MKALSKWLQTNPIVVLLMFIVAMASGVIGIALGWRQFYADFLAKSIEVPLWTVLIVFLVGPSLRAIAAARWKKVERLMEPVKVEGKKFGVEQIAVDGKAFERCEFHGSELIIDGDEPFGFDSCRFVGQHFTLRGRAALIIMALTKMYQDDGFRPLVEHLFQAIRTGEHQKAVSPGEPISMQ